MMRRKKRRLGRWRVHRITLNESGNMGEKRNEGEMEGKREKK